MIYGLLVLIVVAAAIGLTVRVIPEHERAVVFRLGRLRGARGPGPIFAVHGLDDVVRVTTKVVELRVPVRDIVTTDGTTVHVNATVYLRVTDPEKAVLEVDNYRVATAHAANAVIRARLGELPLDALLHRQFGVGSELTEFLNGRTQEWGVNVERAEIADLDVVRNDDVKSVGGGLRVDEPAEFGDF